MTGMADAEDMRAFARWWRIAFADIEGGVGLDMALAALGLRSKTQLSTGCLLPVQSPGLPK